MAFLRLIRLAAVTALVAAAALPGCLDDDEGPLGVVDRVASTPEAWESMLAGPGGDAETSLAVSEDGQTVLVCAHGGFTQASPLWASTDAGATYRRVDPSPNQPFNGDCDVAIGEDGSWSIVYDTIASATFASSTDQGESWWIHPFTAQPVGGVDRPWIMADGDEVVLVWADVMSALPFLAFFMKTGDGGRTWSPPSLMGTFSPPGEINCFMAHVIKSPDGAYQVPIVCGDDGPVSAGPIYILESADGGTTWDRIATGARSGGSIAASYSGDGGLWMTVSEPDGDDSNAHGVVHSTDQGRTFTDPLWLDSGVTAGFGWFWVDGRPDGSATAAWMDAHANETWQVALARVAVQGGQPAIVFDGHVGPVGEEALYEFFMVRHDGQGRAFVSMPQATGPDCFKAGVLPSQAGSGGTPRNRQCVYVVREPVAE